MTKGGKNGQANAQRQTAGQGKQSGGGKTEGGKGSGARGWTPRLGNLRLDADVLRFFRAFGAGYQTRINEVLKAFMHARGGVEAMPRPMPPARAKHANGNGKRAG